MPGLYGVREKCQPLIQGTIECLQLATDRAPSSPGLFDVLEDDVPHYEPAPFLLLPPPPLRISPLITSGISEIPGSLDHISLYRPNFPPLEPDRNPVSFPSQLPSTPRSTDSTWPEVIPRPLKLNLQTKFDDGGRMSATTGASAAAPPARSVSLGPANAFYGGGLRALVGFVVSWYC